MLLALRVVEVPQEVASQRLLPLEGKVVLCQHAQPVVAVPLLSPQAVVLWHLQLVALAGRL